MGLFSKLFGSYSDRELKRIMPIAKAVEAKEEEYGRLSDEQLRHKTEELKARLAEGETLDDIPGPDHRRHRAPPGAYRRDEDR